MPLSIYGISERTFQRRLIVDINLRNEAPEDYREVEELTKKAFWNVNVPAATSIISRIYCVNTPILSPNWTLF